MKPLFLSALFATLLTTGCITQPEEEGLFNNPQKEAKAKECQAMLEEIESLKGKPAQRGAAMEAYQIECQSGATPY